MEVRLQPEDDEGLSASQVSAGESWRLIQFQQLGIEGVWQIPVIIIALWEEKLTDDA